MYLVGSFCQEVGYDSVYNSFGSRKLGFFYQCVEAVAKLYSLIVFPDIIVYLFADGVNLYLYVL